MNIFGFSISRNPSAPISPAKKPRKRASQKNTSVVADSIIQVTSPFVGPYVVGWGLVILMLGIIPGFVLLPLNVAGMYKTVAGVTIFSTAAIWFFGVSPLANAYAGLAGGVWGLLNDELSLREGVEQGIRTLFRAITLASFVFAVVGMIAFFVSFEANPDAYLGLLVLGVVGTLLGLVFKTPTKFGLWLVSGLLVFFAVMMLFGGRFAIPAAENVTAGEMATTASTAVSSAAATAIAGISSGSTATKSTALGTSKPTTGSENFVIPAEGKLVTIPAGTKYFTVQVPRDIQWFCNSNADATPDEINRNSWEKDFSYGALVGNRIIFKAKRELTDDYRLSIDPHVKEEAETDPDCP